MAEVAFDFQNQPANTLRFVRRLESKKLLGSRVHAAAGLAAADSSENGDAGVKSPARNRKPPGMFDRVRMWRLMDLAEHQIKVLASSRLRIGRQLNPEV